jgi:hypothetical protein
MAAMAQFLDCQDNVNMIQSTFKYITESFEPCGVIIDGKQVFLTHQFEPKNVQTLADMVPILFLCFSWSLYFL